MFIYFDTLEYPHIIILLTLPRHRVGLDHLTFDQTYNRKAFFPTNLKHLAGPECELQSAVYAINTIQG